MVISDSLQRSDALQCLTAPGSAPVCVELDAIRFAPLPYQAQGRGRTDRSREELPVERECGLLTLVLSVEMRDAVEITGTVELV